ncbi:MAG: gmk [Acidobacteria bacterium]|nr:gmk [Acidobacteriota bacterium]
MSSSPTLNFHSDGTLFIVSGPSGAGKTTLINRVREQLEPVGIRLHFSVSHTTRQPRAGEREGVDYHFVSRDTFEGMISRGEFLEHAHVHEQLYGTSRSEVQTRLERAEDVILDIDYQGARQIADAPDLFERSVSIFIFPRRSKSWSRDCAPAASTASRKSRPGCGRRSPRSMQEKIFTGTSSSMTI